jgi:hypothetical protein
VVVLGLSCRSISWVRVQVKMPRGECCSSAQLDQFLSMMWTNPLEQELPQGVVAALSSAPWHDMNLAIGER